MRTVMFLTCALGLLTLVGCGDSVAPATPEMVATDLEIYAMEFVQAARSSDQQGQQAIVLLNEYFEENPQPPAEYAAEFAEIKSSAEKLTQLYSGSGSPAEIKQEVDTIAGVADKLPGEVDEILAEAEG